ncbi:MAG TPA: carboxypeptidase regulatory-like domain-containing protein [Thermoanaerobaculia bacterium]|nr:carboxypeptidase regulatory-like domain-containing protein [Thermoanaerobaculia bacterium]
MFRCDAARSLRAFVILAALPAASLFASDGISVTVTGAERGWLVAIPSRDGAAVVASAARGVATPLRVTGDEPVLVCAGADDRATACEQLFPAVDRERTFVLDAGRRVQGRVFIGRAAVAKAKVSVRPAAVEMRHQLSIPLAMRAKEWITSVETAPNGVFTIEHLAPGRYIFEVTTPAGRSDETEPLDVPPLARAKEGAPPPSRTFVLRDWRFAEGGTITVEVRGDDAVPVANALVGVSQELETSARTTETHANAKGSVAVGGIDFTRPVRVSCAAPGFARGSELFDTIPAVVTCTLQRFGTIGGTVVDARGDAVAHATIALAGRNRQTTTDAQGRFALTDIEPGPHMLRVSAPHKNTTTKDVDVSAGAAANIDLALEGAIERRARIIDADTQAPITNASVSAIDTPNERTTSDGDGVIVWSGDARVRISAASYAPATATLGDAEDDSLTNIALQRPATIEVHAWDPRTGDPCRGCTIAAMSSDVASSQTTDGSGFARFADLPPGQYQLTREEVRATSRSVSVSGGSDSRMVSVRAAETKQVELGSRDRRITIALDAPLPAGYAVHATSPAQEVDATPVSAGVYTFRRHALDPYELQLRWPAGGVTIGAIASDQSGDAITISLANAGAKVRVVRGESPAPAMLVQLLDASGRRIAWALTDNAGSASVPYLQPGLYAVLVGDRRAATANIVAGHTAQITAAVE